jgi:hypothetical protein
MALKPNGEGKKYTPTIFQIQPKQLQRLRRLRYKTGLSQSEIIRRALAEYFKNHKD